MLSFIREWGSSTAGTITRLALRMRVSMSEIVSVINLPTGFGHTRNQPIKRALAEGQAGTTELSHIAVAPSAHGAAVHHTRGTGIARQFGQAGIIAFGLQLRAQRRVLLHCFRFLLVTFQP